MSLADDPKTILAEISIDVIAVKNEMETLNNEYIIRPQQVSKELLMERLKDHLYRLRRAIKNTQRLNAVLK